MRQEVTRAHKGWALDSVVLHNDVIKQMKEDITSPPAVTIKNYFYIQQNEIKIRRFIHNEYDNNCIRNHSFCGLVSAMLS